VKHNNKNTNKPAESFEKLEKRLSVPVTRSKEDVWSELENKLSAAGQPAQKAKAINLYIPRTALAIAAGVIIVMSITAVLRFYSVSYVSPQGKRLSLMLPDSSTVILNSDTKLSYYPLWWSFSRELELDGEAWFSVKKGKRFSVYSKRGVTRVLGTSFNIFARDDIYKVECITGKVEVESKITKKHIILNPSDEAEIGADGNILYRKNINLEPVIAWKQGLFIFTSTPLKQVIDEIERRYGVKIELKTDVNAVYTGSFPDSLDVFSAINLVCKPFGLKFAVDKNGTVVITK
jgi:ferric-dicitrate binding protein FerR (iron transport regulator)